MTFAEAGRRGGRKSGDTRLLKGREALKACTTFRELLRVVQELERKAWGRGYKSGERAGYVRGWKRSRGNWAA